MTKNKKKNIGLSQGKSRLKKKKRQAAGRAEGGTPFEYAADAAFSTKE